MINVKSFPAEISRAFAVSMSEYESKKKDTDTTERFIVESKRAALEMRESEAGVMKALEEFGASRALKPRLISGDGLPVHPVFYIGASL